MYYARNELNNQEPEVERDSTDMELKVGYLGERKILFFFVVKNSDREQ